MADIDLQQLSTSREALTTEGLERSNAEVIRAMQEVANVSRIVVGHTPDAEAYTFGLDHDCCCSFWDVRRHVHPALS